MATALQWHVAHNSKTEIVQATERVHNRTATNSDTIFNVANEGVFIVVCESKMHGQDDPDAASVLASEIFRAYRNTAVRTKKIAEEDIAQRMTSAVASGLACAPATENRIVAALVWHNTLFVARSGGHAYLLRQGELQHLTTDEALGDAAALEPEIGQLTLEGEDRVLLCTSAVSDVLQPADMRRWLKMHPSSRRTAQQLLRTVEHEYPGQPEQPMRMIGLAVIDYISGNLDAFPTRQSKPKVERPIVVLPMLTRIRDVVPWVSVAGAALVTAAILAVQSRGTQMPPVYAVSPVLQVQARAQAFPIGTASVPAELPSVSASGQSRSQPVLALPTPNRTWQPVSTLPVPAPVPTNMPTYVPSHFGEEADLAQPEQPEKPVHETHATATPKPAPWLEIRPRVVTVVLGEAVQLRAVVRNADGSTNAQGVVQWQPTDWMTRADARTGVFNATSAGIYTVTAQINTLRAMARVFVLVPITPTNNAITVTTDTHKRE